MLKVQEYLRDHTLEELSDEYGIEYREKNGKVSLNYHQIKSPKGEQICKECRGLILRKDSWEVVSYPFDRFFNYGDPNAPELSIKDIVFVEKEDGSIIQCYFDEMMDEWCLGTRKMPEADGMCENLTVTYKVLALMAFEKIGKPFVELRSELNKDYTYCFELTTPYNQVCVCHREMKMTLIGIRDKITLEELDPQFLNLKLDFPTPVEYRFESAEGIFNFINERSPAEHEGVIGRSLSVVDSKSFARVKFKSVPYVAMHGAISDMQASDRNILRLILLEQIDDVFPMVDNFLKKKIMDIEKQAATFIRAIERDWKELKDIPIQKDFALAAKKTIFPGALFYLRKTEGSTISDFMKMQAESKSNVAKLLDRLSVVDAL